MTPAERGEIVVTGRLLEAVGRLDALSIGLTLIPAAALVFSSPHRIAAITAVALGLVARLYSLRVAFDARLFLDLAADTLTAADLDAAFPDKSGRSWTARCAGGRRLAIVFGALVVLQCVAVVASGW